MEIADILDINDESNDFFNDREGAIEEARAKAKEELL